MALTHGNLQGKEGVLARIHDQCLTSEVFGSKRCDCKEQLGMALDRVRALPCVGREKGEVVVLRLADLTRWVVRWMNRSARRTVW